MAAHAILGRHVSIPPGNRFQLQSRESARARACCYIPGTLYNRKSYSERSPS